MFAKKIIAAAIVAFLLTAPVMAQSSTPEGVVDKWAKVWNSHDPVEYGKLFTTDAHFIVVYDEINQGREKIVADFKLAHGGWAKMARMKPGKVSTRRLGDKAAVVYFNVLTEMTSSPQVPGQGRTVQFVVIKERSGWLISAGQLSKPNCPK